MKLRFFLLPLFVALPLFGGFIPPAQTEKATPGDTALTEYFRNETAALSEHCLADIKTLDDWKSKRDEYRRQMQEMLGLWPMPERTDLKPVVTGRLTNDEFTVEKIYFQASPRLYCTANLYLPRRLDKPAPTILYMCGHLRQMTNGVSLGNKVGYQQDGAWFARNGYVCLVMDSLRDGEIQGLHTGTRNLGLWWWNSRGYTPAGVEAWFGIRALDYLCTRPEVDTNRFGITGHSGGGAYSWTITALDDRIKAAAPLAGMTDIQSHILDGVMDSHCDCNFFINTYRWDFPQLAALAGPRPLLIGCTDNDRLFRLESVMRLHEKVRRIYRLYEATNKLGLAIAPGPHDETPELQLAVMRWFNRHLKGEELPVETAAKRFFTPDQLRVFDQLPADAINTNIAETFVPQAATQKLVSGQSHPLTPALSPALSGGEGGRTERGPGEGVVGNADELRAALREKVFAGWPNEETPLVPKHAFEIKQDDLRLRAWDFTSQHDVLLRLYLLDDAAASSAETVLLTALDQAGATNWLADVRALAGGHAQFSENLAGEFAGTNLPTADFAALEKLKREVLDRHAALAFFAPRGVGLTAWSGDEKRLTQIRRRFMLLGQTLDGMRVWDIRRAIQAIRRVRDTDSPRVELRAEGAMAVNALYAALFEPAVRKLELANLPQSHMQGPDYLNVLKVTDIRQVTELVAASAELKLKQK